MDTTASDRVLRLSAATLLVGALLEGIGALATIPFGSIGSANRTTWVLVHFVLLLGATALLLGLPALVLTYAREIRVLGMLGGVLVFVGFLGIGFFVAAVQTFLLPWVYDTGSCTLGCHLLSTSDGPPLYAAFFAVEALATFVGLILLGLSLARAHIATGAGYLMALAGLVALPLTFFSVIPVIPVLLAMVAVIWLALQLLTGEARPD